MFNLVNGFRDFFLWLGTRFVSFSQHYLCRLPNNEHCPNWNKYSLMNRIDTKITYTLWVNVSLEHFNLERFSFECRKVIGFAFATLHDLLKKFAPISHPIKGKTKTNRDSLASVFPRFASATYNYLEFWLAHCIMWVLCDWLE